VESYGKQLCNDTMVMSQRGALISAKIESGETVDDLSERLQNVAVGLPELEGAAGDAVRLRKSSRCTRTASAGIMTTLSRR
jgi:hypothetical protein